MIRSRVVLVAALALFAGMSTGCKNNLKAERDQLFEENVSLRDQVTQLSDALESCERDRNDLAQANSEFRMENEDLKSQLAGAGERGATGFENIPGVTGEFRPGEVTAIVESDLLFDSGSATLKSGARQSLDRVVSVLNSTYSGRKIRVEGHTDSDPIRKSQWKTNDRLSCERAMSVKEHLENHGIASNRMYVAGFGNSRPKGTKKDSRRVEIVVVLE
ncbi:MAG: flagellar motor protein MotB [Phycisphaerales bacterium]